MQFIKRSMGWVVWRAYQFLRVHFFSLVSTNCNINGMPLRHQPVLFSGTGKIIFSQNVKFGFNQSPSGRPVNMVSPKQSSFNILLLDQLLMVTSPPHVDWRKSCKSYTSIIK